MSSSSPRLGLGEPRKLGQNEISRTSGQQLIPGLVEVHYELLRDGRHGEENLAQGYAENTAFRDYDSSFANSKRYELFWRSQQITADFGVPFMEGGDGVCSCILLLLFEDRFRV